MLHPERARRRASSRRIARTLAVPVSAVASNALAYALVLVAARVLDHAHYGSFVALTTMIVVGSIPALALQAVAARRVASGEGTAGVVRVTWMFALGSGALVAVLADPLDRFLHIDSLAATLWLAAGLVPMTLIGPLIGLVQGAERLIPFSGLSLVQALGRFGGCLVLLVAAHDEAYAMAGAAVGAAVAVLAAYLLRSRELLHRGSARADTRSVLAESGHALHGYAAILVLTSLDLLLARHLLGSEQSAQYAAGSVVTKSVVWLPQSIGLLAFARMAAREQHLKVVRLAAALVAVIGLLGTAGSAVFGDLVAAVVGGDFHVLRTSAWVFALLGTSLAVLQFTVVAGLAARSSRRLVIVWLAAVAETVIVFAVRPAGAVHLVEVATAVVATAAVVAVWTATGLPMPRRPSRPSRPRRAPSDGARG